MPTPTPRTLNTAQFNAVEAAAFFDEPIATVRVTAGDEAANVRRLTLQVIDRREQRWAGRWLVLLYFAETSGGAPGGTHTVSVVTGTLLQEIAADSVLLLLTEADGTASVDVAVAGAAERFAGTAVVGRAGFSRSLAWS